MPRTPLSISFLCRRYFFFAHRCRARRSESPGDTVKARPLFLEQSFPLSFFFFSLCSSQVNGRPELGTGVVRFHGKVKNNPATFIGLSFLVRWEKQRFVQRRGLL